MKFKANIGKLKVGGIDVKSVVSKTTKGKKTKATPESIIKNIK